MTGSVEAHPVCKLSCRPQPSLPVNRSETCAVLVVTEKIAHGAVGIVWSGSLLSQSSTLDPRVVAKIATDPDSIIALKHEFSIYQLAHPSGTISPCIGLFERKDFAVLLLKYLGTPLSTFDVATSTLR